MYYTEKADLEAIILSLDFSKCFDRIDHTTILKSLQYFGFSKIIQDWTKLFYSGFNVRVQNDGYFSKPLAIERGVHQGGACSVEYFLVCAEILAIKFRSNDRIKGIPIGDILAILGQYADDMDNYQLFDEESLTATLEELERFRIASGFMVNYDKTNIYRIGSLRNSNARIHTQKPLNWTSEGLNILGVEVCEDITELFKRNYDNLILKTESILRQWHARHLSLEGKVLVVNTLITLLFVYKMTVLPELPKHYVNKLDQIVESFLWNGRRPKIKKDILQLAKKDGGLNLTNFSWKDMAMKITWLEALPTDHILSALAYECLSPELQSNIWRCNMKRGDAYHVNPDPVFWTDVLNAWGAINYSPITYPQQWIWWNSNITIQGKPFFWKTAYENGLRTIEQLFNNGQAIGVKKARELFTLTTMQYNSLISAIPKICKDILSGTWGALRNDFIDRYEELLVCGKVAKFAYGKLSSDPLGLCNLLDRWVNDGQNITYEHLIHALQVTRQVTKNRSTKLRSFQYRLIHRSIVTNIQLCYWKISDSTLCTFCKKERESINHLFFQCNIVNELWLQVDNFMNLFSDTEIDLTWENVLWNSIVPEDDCHIKNYICLITKQFIY